MTDISKKTVAVLLILAIVLSAIGTWQLLNRNIEVRPANPSGTAEVRVEISGQTVLQTDTSQGKISVNIV